MPKTIKSCVVESFLLVASQITVISEFISIAQMAKQYLKICNLIA